MRGVTTLALAGLLAVSGAALLGLSALTSAEMRAALVAQVGGFTSFNTNVQYNTVNPYGTLSGPSPTTVTSLPTGAFGNVSTDSDKIKKLCDQKVAKAVSLSLEEQKKGVDVNMHSDGLDPANSDANKNGKAKDDCLSVIVKPQAYVNPPSKPKYLKEDFQCVGKGTTITMPQANINSDFSASGQNSVAGTVAVTDPKEEYKTDSSVPAGKCKVYTIDKNGIKRAAGLQDLSSGMAYSNLASGSNNYAASTAQSLMNTSDLTQRQAIISEFKGNGGDLEQLNNTLKSNSNYESISSGEKQNIDAAIKEIAGSSNENNSGGAGQNPQTGGDPQALNKDLWQGPCNEGQVQGPGGCVPVGQFQGPCQPGQAQTATGCQQSSPGGSNPLGGGRITSGPAPGYATPGVGGGAMGAGGMGGLGNMTGGGMGGGMGSGLNSLLQGLMRGMMTGQMANMLGGNNNSSNQNNQNQCAQQFICTGNQLMWRSPACQMQPVQTCQYGCSPTGTSCATSPTSTYPYGVGTDGIPCSQPPTQPDTSTCTGGTWTQTTAANGCKAAWQCVSSGPGAQLSCQPQTVDEGMSVSLSFACGTSSIRSLGYGFSTNGALSGSQVVTATSSSATSTTQTYSLECANTIATSSAQCVVNVVKPVILLAATPAVVHPGESSVIGWVTGGMQSCVISSPTRPDFTSQNAANTRTSGAVLLPGIATTTEINLTCTTRGGQTRTASTTIQVVASNISIQSNASSSASLGNTINIQWQSTNPPANSSMSLWLVDLQVQQAIRVIAGGLPNTGTYTWHVPVQGATCDRNTQRVCTEDLVPGRSYAIEALQYTPAGAYVGDGVRDPAQMNPTYLNSATTASFVMQ